MIRRRMVLGGLLGGGSALAAWPALATPREVELEMAKVTGGRTPQPGHVTLDLAQMVENGNAVGVVVSASAPEGRRVAGLHVFAEGNPNPEVLHATFGPAAFAPRLATRMRLATSQTVVAVAVMDDGSCWTDSVSVIVTLAACLSDAMRVLLNVPKTVRRGEAIEVRILISHPMESGQRRDEMGALVPRMVINDFRCVYNGVEVLQVALFPAIAANPFLSFAARADASGELSFSWRDDSGAMQTETARVEVV